MSIENIKAQLPSLTNDEVRYIMDDARNRVLGATYKPYIEAQTAIVFACSVELAQRGE